MKKNLILFISIVFGMAVFIIATAHPGTKSIATIAKPQYQDGDFEEGHRNDNLKAIIDGKEYDYYAASETRCDELYKYCHCIGRGTITGLNQLNYFYVPNDSFRLITIEQLIAEQNGKSKR